MDLKLCLFCGGEAKLDELCRGYVYISCEKCGLQKQKADQEHRSTLGSRGGSIPSPRSI